jgi:hypothetical protein
MERREMHVKFWYGIMKTEDCSKDIFLDGIILEWRMWTGFILPMIGTIDGYH